MMMAAENRIGCATSVADCEITSNLPRQPIEVRTRCSIGSPVWCAAALSVRCRKMFSTMMTEASTMRPKSIAPTDSRLADSPRQTIRPMANASANGIVAATTTALRRLPRKAHCSTKISAMPSTRLCSTVCVVWAMSSLRS